MFQDWSWPNKPMYDTSWYKSVWPNITGNGKVGSVKQWAVSPVDIMDIMDIMDIIDIIDIIDKDRALDKPCMDKLIYLSHTTAVLHCTAYE